MFPVIRSVCLIKCEASLRNGGILRRKIRCCENLVFPLYRVDEICCFGISGGERIDLIDVAPT